MSTVGLASWGASAFRGDRRQLLVPGRTTDGHYQIELSCESCHTEPFADRDAIQAACVGCHGAELRASDDSHPKSKFTDPRNADRVAKLDARYCITCHVEHDPEATSSMGLTLPGDYCLRCHEDVAEERPSHEGLAFDTCANAGCHNFHDNRSLYEDFLREHGNEPDLLAEPHVAARTVAAVGKPPPADGEAPDGWDGSAHQTAGVKCEDCHGARAEGAAGFHAKVGRKVCAKCHEANYDEFLRGRHGMRLAEGLSPMRPGMARLPMKANAADRQLGCTSCHEAHRFDTRRAAFEACVECHDDPHTKAYVGSPHYASFERELAGQAPPGTGVSCSTCHMARHVEGDGAVHVQHDQSANLRPNEKMAREVCIQCHGLRLVLDALADPALIERQFRNRPSAHVASIDWALAQ